MPTDQQVLHQMAKGLHYIHSQIVNDLPNLRSQPLIHRDVKPKNILISCDNPSVIKWVDFGLSRNVVNGSRSFTWSQLKETDRWLAPELIQSDVKTKVRGSQRCDVFALGCVFFFFLKQGMHPFGDDNTAQGNIDNGIQVNLNRKQFLNLLFITCFLIKILFINRV
jgi:serine/threonine protein kinase